VPTFAQWGEEKISNIKQQSPKNSEFSTSAQGTQEIQIQL
jgi:hypothetical protein